MSNVYVCECGKEFAKSQQLSGHQRACKEHFLSRDGNLEKWELNKSHYDNYNKNKKLETKENKQKVIDIWLSEQHTCEKCGKVMTEYYGSGRFCSRACANSREQTEDINNKRSNTLRLKYDSLERNYCKNCGKEISQHNKSGYCRSCFYKFVPYPEEVKKKQSLIMQGRTRWHIHRNQPSYAELFFENVFNNNNIPFERELQVKREDNHHCYYLDFVIKRNNKVYDIEIDGSQHKYRKELDNERDNYLTSIGYIVYRIEWNNINTENGKSLMSKKIEDLLLFINMAD